MGGSDAYIGMLLLVPYNFAPRGWHFCDGSLLSISANEALFNLLGTTYGGDGQTTFGVPDLRGRSCIHAGQGPGLGSYVLGQLGGAENITLTTQTMPTHAHASYCTGTTQNNSIPNGAVLASGPGIYTDTPSTGAALAPASISVSGGSQPHNNMQPFQVLNWVIALEGIYPSQG